MSSSPEGLQQNDYLSVALLTVIAYDYVLTLPREIDYIWKRRWTMVSVLFVLVRYCGLFILTVYTLMWSSFLPGPVKTCVLDLCVGKLSGVTLIIQLNLKGEILWLASIWAFLVWIGASDLVMILRVWAMYNRSKTVLTFLLTVWSTEIILSTLTCIMYPKKITVAVTQVGDLSYCGVTSASVLWTKVSAVSEIVSSGIICLFVLFQFTRRALDMYRVTKRWRFNRYMNLFAGQSVLYLLFIVFFNRTAILVASGQFQTEGWGAILGLPFEYVPAFALTPRFIMSVRALYEEPTEGSQGRSSETGGFVISGSNQGDRNSTFMLDVRRHSSEMMTTQDEEIPMEEWRLTGKHSDKPIAY